jgi:hypothetical protein
MGSDAFGAEAVSAALHQTHAQRTLAAILPALTATPEADAV